MTIYRKRKRTKKDWTTASYSAYRRKRFVDLYENDWGIIGWDYVICPESGERFSKITKSYIEKVLKLTIADYEDRYPGVQRTALGHRKNISSGLKEIDSDTGLTKHEAIVMKAKETLSRVDPETGLSGYAAKGLETKATHMANVDEHGRNGFERLVHHRLTTILEDGRTVEQRAHQRRLDGIVARNGSSGRKASRVSKKVLAPVLKLLQENGIRYYFDRAEFGIRSGDRHYFYDLVMPDLKLAVEYQSFAYHADPWLSEDEWKNWRCLYKQSTAAEVLTYDYEKARALWRLRDYQTYHVWENSAESDVEHLLCLLKTMIMKSGLLPDGKILEV